jgi:putative transposase
MVAPGQKEQCAEFAIKSFKIAHARACRLFNCSRQRKYYSKKMPVKDKPIIEAIQNAIGCSRKGRKKVIPIVRRKCPEFSTCSIRRVYSRHGFSLMKRHKRRIRNHAANPASVPLSANGEWAIDFMHDALTTGRQIRSLNIIDPFNRECKGIFIDYSIPASKVIEFLEQAIESNGKPLSIRTDNGPEFISKRFQLWLKNNKIAWNPIQKGKPQQNCHIERLNKTIREDLFDAHLIDSIEHGNDLAAQFRHEYNCNRPHESLSNLTPIEYAA